MNEDFLIRIDGRMEQGDESDSVQLMTRGSFVRRGGSFFISYKESETTGYEGCTTTVKVAKDESKVSMTRFGPAAGQLVVEKGIRHLCHYDTGYGPMMIGVSGDRVVSELGDLGVAADEIHSRLTDEGGEVEFSYTLDADQNTILSRNLVKISVKRTGPLT